MSFHFDPEEKKYLLAIFVIIILLAIAAIYFGLRMFIQFIDRILKRVGDNWRPRLEGRSYVLPAPSASAVKWIVQGEPASCASKFLAGLIFILYIPVFIYESVSQNIVGVFLGLKWANYTEVAWLVFFLFTLTVLLHTFRIYYFIDKLEDPFAEIHWLYVRSLSSIWYMLGMQVIRLGILICLIWVSYTIPHAKVEDVLPLMFESLLFLYCGCLSWDIVVWKGAKCSLLHKTFFVLNLINITMSVLIIISLKYFSDDLQLFSIAIGVIVICLSTLYSLFTWKSSVSIANELSLRSFAGELLLHLISPYFGRQCTLQRAEVLVSDEGSRIATSTTSETATIIQCNGPDLEKELVKHGV